MSGEIEKHLDKLLDKRDYKPITKKAYKNWLIKLHNYYPNKKLSQITFQEIEKYIKQLITRKKGTYDTIRQLTYACNFLYNDILNKNYKFYKIKLPSLDRKEKDYLTQEEILILLDYIQNKKHKAIIATIYSCYLELNELLNLKLKDINSKKGILKVYSNSTNSSRDCILSDSLLEIFKEYYNSLVTKPQLYLFEGQKVGAKYSGTSLRKFLNKYVTECEIQKDITPTSLRMSGIKHLTELGTPLYTILKSLGMNDLKTYENYNKFCYENYKISFSPLDKIIVKPKLNDFELFDIENLVFKVKDKELKNYLKEAIACLRVGALKAGVIFIWTAGIRLIQYRIIENYQLKEINKELKTIYPKAKDIKTINDFSFIKDDFTIQLSSRLGLYDKNQKNELINSCLGLRNKCGHPSNYNPQPNKVKSYIEDMMEMIFY
ncbi:tyrosine-type recombinase/integrase [uncultured Lutibacter sp.]|uniref:tyrosine-type recombinase/integrase n=1 Tax=uncultured Lutibacter sp. TaxID=437739 RepID=UPI002615DD7A|nr:tyrosine-type recombinase/integrase [uncultured Lutibacter sp.]